MIKYQPGQRWTYRTREYDIDSRILIGKIQKRILLQPIVHVTVLNVKPNPTSDSIDIGHMPFSRKAIEESVIALTESGVAIGPQFHEGFQMWSTNKGGVFDIPVSQAVDAVLSTVPYSGVDPFDSMVTKMRGEKSEAMISELYRLLFSIDRWFFLCRPDNARAPVEWAFTDGHNKSPALLAFTRQERAAP